VRRRNLVILGDCERLWRKPIVMGILFIRASRAVAPVLLEEVVHLKGDQGDKQRASIA
jgi:hypothetical protein